MTAPTSKQQPTVIVHRSGFSHEKRALLEEAGVVVIHARSVHETISAAERSAGACVVVVSLSVGSQAPEQVFAGVRALQEGGRADVHLVATSPPGSNKNRRARKLGIELVYGWPEGAFHEVVKLVSTAPSVVMRRFSERAQVTRKISAGEELGLDARIVNISTTGAMLDCAAIGTKLEGIGFEFSLGGATQAPIFGRVIWREEHGKRVRLGLQFVDVSDGTRAAIDRFVRETNVIRVNRTSPPTRAAAPGRTVRVVRGSRRDYFQLDEDDGGLVLVPKTQFFVPYEIGDEVDIVTPGSRAPPLRARITARRPLDPERIDSRISWHVEPVRKGPVADSGRVTVASMSTFNVDEEITGPTEIPRPVPMPLRRRDPRWAPLSQLVDALAAGQDPLAGVTHIIVMPAVAGSTLEFSARTFMMALEGTGSMLLFRESDRSLPLPPAADEQLIVTIGRDSASDVVIDNPTVSKVHARLVWEPPSWHLEDLGSSNGTRLRLDAFAEHETQLKPGERHAVQASNVLRIGKQRLHVVSVADLRATLDDLLAKRLIRRRG